MDVSELRGWELGPNATDDARRKEWLMHEAADEIEQLRHELECLRAQHEQREYPCSPHCSGYLRELALRNSRQLSK